LLSWNYSIPGAPISNRFKSGTSIYLFSAILFLIISSIVEYRISISEASTNKVSKGLISCLNISFDLGTGIREKPVNNNGYSWGLSLGIISNKVVAFPVLFLLLILFFLLYWLNTYSISPCFRQAGYT
jgi:hypothetical protein